MNTLAVETALDALGICVFKEDIPVFNYYSACKRRTAEIIFTILEDALKNNHLDLKDIDRYVITHGPGAYTGVRIGMSMVKTFAQVYQKPLIGINTLQVLADQLMPLDEPFYVLLNCSRSEVFYARFQFKKEFPEQISDIHLSSIEDLWPRLQSMPVTLKQISTKSTSPLFQQIQSLPKQYPFSDAFQLLRTAQRLYPSKQIQDLCPVNPLYLKKDIEDPH
jgi:tRNA threonylcarbamoyladenosine biosynthesis protein TsaB